jgi:hypothetical protein
VIWAYGVRDRWGASDPATYTVGRQTGFKRYRWSRGGEAFQCRTTGLQTIPAWTQGGSHRTTRACAPTTGACCLTSPTPLGRGHSTSADNKCLHRCGGPCADTMHSESSGRKNTPCHRVPLNNSHRAMPSVQAPCRAGVAERRS